MEFSKKTIWITWHEHRRTRSLVHWLDIPVFVYDDHKTLNRYTVGPLWTLKVLLRERPDVVFTHFSFVLQLMIVVYKYLFRFGNVKVVSDCHNKALKRKIDGPLSLIFLQFKKLVFHGTDLIVVTNTSLIDFARVYCSQVAILRDPLTDWEGSDEKARVSKVDTNSDYIFYICSFDKDEPIELIFDSALAITQELNCQVFISGRIPEQDVPERIKASNDVVLTGFMSIEKYQETLFLASAVVVLTEDDDCLVCGAYESIGASIPTVLSKTASLKACFGGSACYTMHTPEDIVKQVRLALATSGESVESKRYFEKSWLAEWDAFKSKLWSILG